VPYTKTITDTRRWCHFMSCFRTAVDWFMKVAVWVVGVTAGPLRRHGRGWSAALGNYGARNTRTK